MGENERVIDWDGGQLRVSHLIDGVVLFKLRGTMPAGAEEDIIAATDEAIRRATSVHVFHDWEDMTGYEPSSRKRLTEYVQSIEGSLLSAHILFRSKVVAMGISIANMVLRKPLWAYSDRSMFEAALKKALRSPT